MIHTLYIHIMYMYASLYTVNKIFIFLFSLCLLISYITLIYKFHTINKRKHFVFLWWKTSKQKLPIIGFILNYLMLINLDIYLP